MQGMKQEIVSLRDALKDVLEEYQEMKEETASLRNEVAALKARDDSASEMS